ncbi:MAG: response regulator [Planctomycetota bacterium]|nr:response regulator [Planctomycetota bacterium]
MNEPAIVFVVDDDPAARESVCALVESMGLKFAAFPSAEAFLAARRADVAGCVVADLSMEGMSGLDLQRKLADSGDHIPIVVISAVASVPAAVRAMQEGAVTLLEKPCGSQELWDAISTAIQRDARARERHRQQHRVAERLATLTVDERRVLDMLVTGQPNKTIALRFDVSQRTIESRRRSVFKKMGAGNLAELVTMLARGNALDDQP